MNMNKTTKNFLKALENYNPPETVAVVWKLCYDKETGVILDLTTEETVLAYIEISRLEADQNPHLNPYARVVDGELIYLEHRKIITDHIHNLKVHKHKDGKIVSDDYNMLLLNNQGKNRWYCD